MGADFSNHRLFIGGRDAVSVRDMLAPWMCESLGALGYREVAAEEDADRSFVIAPDGKWVFIGDSAGSTEYADPDAFDAFSLKLSTLGPVIDTKMSDSAAVHFYLYKCGEMIDKFGNAAFPFYQFPNSDEAARFQGSPESWVEFLESENRIRSLREVWVQEWNADQILLSTVQLLGWNMRLAYVGYTFDDEGLPEKYDVYLQNRGIDLTTFKELHFKMNEIASIDFT